MSRSPFDDPYHREHMMRNGIDPREIMHYMREMTDRIDRLEKQVNTQPNVLAFVQVNYPEIIEQYEMVQATKKKIGAKKI
jgi:hypothetical protein